MDGRKYSLRTLGCKANFADGQAIEAELQKRGWHPAATRGEADLCIVNSCTVTDEADRQSRKLAARLGRENPTARVVVTGCAAEVDPERLQNSVGIHYVVGNQDKPRLVELVLQALARERPLRGESLGGVEGYAEMRSRHPLDREWPLPDSLDADAPGEGARTRAFLRIQEGCNAFCTYCIIPYGRGPSRSASVAQLVEQVRGLVAQGTREVVLTGTNIGDYGTDWNEEPQLAALIRALLRETAIDRIRLGSLDPAEITPEILALLATEPRLCPHIHFSLQSAHSRVLRAMKRKYTAEMAQDRLEKLARLPRPIYVGMDVITGFPGETAEEFEESFRRLAQWPWSRMHVFPYSEREGTPATRLPGSVAPAERQARAERLRALSDTRLRELYEARLARGRVEGVLWEGHGRDEVDGQPGWMGHTADYLRVWVPAVFGRESQRNQYAEVRVSGLRADAAAGEYRLVGEIST